MTFKERLKQARTNKKISQQELVNLALLMQFKKVEKLPGDKKKLVKEFLDAFLFKDSVQKQLVL
ncbi:MAG: hypothetical protein ABIJ04_03930 [Bacteroidota bacterium]